MPAAQAEPVSAVEAAPAPAQEALIPEAVAAPVAPEPQPVNLDEVLAESGLVMVQTTAASAPAVSEAPAAPVGRPRRKRFADEPAAEEPLMMVETKK
jgi:hypothetical protein